MSEYKQIKTRIWQDNWFLTLTSEEKLLWIFLLTNEYSHISGLYELPSPLIAPLTGIQKWSEMLEKFEKDKKIKVLDGWVYVLNKTKHQPISDNIKDKVNISIKRYLEENKDILARIKEKQEAPSKGLKAPCQTLRQIESKRESKNKREIETIAVASTAQDNPPLEVIPNLLEDKNRHIQIIGLFARAKGIHFKGKEEQGAFIRRNLRAAQNLAAYSKERVIEVMMYLRENADFKWTLETVGKYIDEDLSKLKTIGKNENDIIKSLLDK